MLPKHMRIPAVVWGRAEGWVSVPIRKGERWQERWFEWPQDVRLIAAFVKKANRDSDVYWSPLVYPEPSRQEALSCSSRWAWADLDDTDDVDGLDPIPSIAWESSPGNIQGIYLLDKQYDASTVESFNRRIAYATDADPSGWDAGQVLRWPGTKNYKYDPAPLGRVLRVSKTQFTRKDLEQYEHPPMPEPVDIDPGSLSYDEAMDKYGDLIPLEAWPLLDETVEVEHGKRSVNLWTLIRALTEAGVPADGVYALSQGSPWNKFRGRRDEAKRLSSEVEKAFARFAPVVVDDQPPLELEVIKQADPAETDLPKSDYGFLTGWLAEYMRVGRQYSPDSPEKYLLAGGLALLSIAAGQMLVANPTIRRNVHPALYLMIIGPTRSGKTRAIRYATEVLHRSGIPCKKLDEFSQEGFLRAMENAPGNQVLWEAEEISQVMKQASRRNSYMSTVPEMLLRLHDRSTGGGEYVRELSRTPVRIATPHLTIIGATTEENYHQSFSQESMHTGLLPRWLQFYDPSPPMPEYGRASASLGREVEGVARGLADLRALLQQAPQQTLEIRTGGRRRVPVRWTGTVEADMTAAAFERWVEWMMDNDRISRESPLLGPILAEGGQHVLKLAMLMALSRRPEIMLGGLNVDYEDVEAAIRIIHMERDTNARLYALLGHGEWERTLQRVSDYVREHRRVSRTDVQQSLGRYIQTARNMDEIERTLVDRGLIEVVMERQRKAGRPRRVYVAKRRRRANTGEA